MTNWRQAAARMRSDLDRADLSGRARRLAEFVVKATLGRGRSRVVVPNAGALARFLKIGANHLAETVAGLESARIVKFRAVADGWEVLTFSDSSSWAVDWLYGDEELTNVLAELDRCPGQTQGELIEPDPCLERARSEASAESVGKPDFPCREVTLPEMGSPTCHDGKSQIPVSGSPVPLNVQRLTAQSTERLNVERLTADQEAKLMARVGQFVGAADMANWGGDWRCNWVRKMPKALTKALAILEAESRDGWKPHKSRAAALKDLARRLPV